jgi:hypothetical protein
MKRRAFGGLLPMQPSSEISPPTMTVLTLGSVEGQVFNERTEIKQENIYTLFGTKGCLLNCDNRKKIQTLLAEGLRHARGAMITSKRNINISERITTLLSCVN